MDAPDGKCGRIASIYARICYGEESANVHWYQHVTRGEQDIEAPDSDMKRGSIQCWSGSVRLLCMLIPESRLSPTVTMAGPLILFTLWMNLVFSNSPEYHLVIAYCRRRLAAIHRRTADVFCAHNGS